MSIGTGLRHTFGMTSVLRRYCVGIFTVGGICALIGSGSAAQAEDCTVLSKKAAFCADGTDWRNLAGNQGPIFYFSGGGIDLSLPVLPFSAGDAQQQAAHFESSVASMRDTGFDNLGRPIRNWRGDVLRFQDGTMHRSIYTMDRIGPVTFASSMYVLGRGRILHVTTTQKVEGFTPAHDAAHKDALARLKLN